MEFPRKQRDDLKEKIAGLVNHGLGNREIAEELKDVCGLNEKLIALIRDYQTDIGSVVDSMFPNKNRENLILEVIRSYHTKRHAAVHYRTEFSPTLCLEALFVELKLNNNEIIEVRKRIGTLF